MFAGDTAKTQGYPDDQTDHPGEEERPEERSPVTSHAFHVVSAFHASKISEKAGDSVESTSRNFVWKERCYNMTKSNSVDEEIAEVLAMSTGIPVFKLTQTETAKLLNMEDELSASRHWPSEFLPGAWHKASSGCRAVDRKSVV